MEMGHIAALFKDTIAGVTPLYGSTPTIGFPMHIPRAEMINQLIPELRVATFSGSRGPIGFFSHLKKAIIWFEVALGGFQKQSLRLAPRNENSSGVHAQYSGRYRHSSDARQQCISSFLAQRVL
jgi:hypothetical protein